jgi:chemotaxis protein MotB
VRGKSRGRYGPGRRGRKEDDSSNRWLGTYGDAVTLLMAFFVMLYAMAELDVVKFQAFVQGLQQPFGNTSDAEGLLDAGPSIVGDAATSADSQLPEIRPEPVAAHIPSPAEPEAVEEESPDDRAQLEKVRKQIKGALEANGLRADVADFRHDERGLVVSIASDDILFALGSTEINPVGRKVIGTIAKVLADKPNRVLVEGHTDNVPLRRPGYSNWNLSTDRAVAVLEALIERHNLSPKRLSAVGYAEYRPRVPNDTRAKRSLNRRVDLVIVLQGRANHE